MAERINNSIDALGRSTPPITAGAMKQMLASNKVGAPVPYESGKKETKKPDKQSEAFSKIITILEKMEPGISSMADRTQKHVEEGSQKARFVRDTGPQSTANNPKKNSFGFMGMVNTLLQRLPKKMSPDGTTDKVITQELLTSNQGIEKDLTNSFKLEKAYNLKKKYSTFDKLAQAGLKKGSIYTHDVHVVDALEKLVAALSSISGVGASSAGSGTPPPTPPTTTPAPAPTPPPEPKMGVLEKLMRVKAATSIISGPMNIIQTMFGDIQDANDAIFAQQMKQIAFVTKGIGGSTNELQKEWVEVGKQAVQTGVQLTDFQTRLVSNLRKGVVSRQQEIKLLKTSLNLSTMIGANADEVSSTFHDWQMNMGLNVNQLSEVSRGIQRVGKMTGLAGDELLAAAKNAEPFLKSLRDAGNLSAKTAENVIQLSASSQKLGVGNQMATLMESLSSGANLLLSSSSETKNLLYMAAARMGKITELQNGTLIRTKQGIKDLSSGIKNMVAEWSGVPWDEIDKLSDDKKLNLNLVLKQATGMQMGELQQLVKATDEGSQSIIDKQNEITKAMQNGNLTAQERLNLEQQMAKIQSGQGMSYLTAFDEAAKNVGVSFKDAATSASEKMGDEFDANLKQMGIAVTDPIDKLRAAAQITADSIKKSGGEDFAGALDAALKTQDISGLRSVLEQMNAAQQKLDVKDAKGIDPMTKMGQTIMEVNETIRNVTSPIQQTLQQILGSNGLIAASLLSLSPSVVNGFSALKGVLGGVFGRFGGSKAAAGVLNNAGALAGGAATATTAATGTVASTAAQTGTAAAVNSAQAAAIPATAGAGLKIPQFDASGLRAGGVNLIKSAAAMALVAIGLTAVAASILVISGKISKLTGMSPTEMLKMGATIAGLILGVGAIAAAVRGAAEGLALLTTVEELIPEMLVGAAVLVVLAPALTALAAGILKISDLIMGGFGITAESAAKTALGVASLIASAGAIAIAVMAASASLAILGALAAGAGWESILFILGGAAVLVAMTPAMELLAAAVVGMSYAILKYVINPETAAKTAFGVSKLILSASLIAAAVLASSAALATLGLLAIPGLIAIPFMMIGASTLASLIPAMTLLAASVVAFTSAITYFVDPDKAAATAWSVTKLLFAAAAIATAVIAASAGLAALGVLGVVALVLSPLMAIGAATLWNLTSPMVLLASAITFMTDKILSVVVDPEKASDTAWNVAKLLLAASAIAASVLAASTGLAALGLLGIASIFLIPLMAAGAGTLMALTPAMIGLAAAVVKMSEGLMSLTVSPKEAAETASALADLMESVASIAWTVTKMSAKLALLAGLALFTPLIYMGASVLYGMTGGLIELASAVTSLVNSDKGLTPRTMNLAVAKLNATSQLLEAVSSALKTMTEKLIPLTANFFSFLGFSSDLDKIIAKSDVILDAIMDVVFFTHMLVRTLKIFKIGDVNRSVKIINDIGRLMDGLATTLGIVGGKLSDAAKQIGSYTWFTGQFVSVTPKLIDALNSTMDFVKDVLDTSNKFDPADLADLTKNMKSMGDLLANVGEVMNVMSDKLAKMDEGWGIFDTAIDNIIEDKDDLVAGFKSIGSFVTDIQSVVATIDETSLTSLSKTISNIADVLESLGKALGVMGGPLADMTDGTLWTSFHSVASNAENSAKPIGEAFASVGNLIMQIKENLSSINAKDVQDVASVVKGIADVLPALQKSIELMGGPMASLADGWGTSTWGSAVGNAASAAGPLSDGFAAVAKLIEGIKSNLGDLNPEEIKGVAATLTGISDTFTALANSFGTIQDKLIPLLGGTFSSGTIEDLQKSQAGLEAGIYTLQIFAKGLVAQVRSVAVDPSEIKKIADTLVAISDVFGKLGESIGVMKEKLVPLTSEDFDDSIIAEISRSQSQLIIGISTLAVFAKTITSVLRGTFSSEQINDLKVAGTVLELIGTVFTNFAKAVNVIKDSLLPITNASFDRSLIAKIQSRQSELEAGLFTLASFVKNIVSMLRSVFNNKDLHDLQVAARVLTDMGAVMTGFAKSITVLQEQLLPLTNAKFDRSLIAKIQNVQPQLEAGFYTLSAFVKDMLNVLRSTFNDDDLKYLQKSASTMTNMATVMTNFNTAMKVMQEQLIPLTNTKFDQSLIGKMQASQKDLEAGFYTLAVFVREGILEVLRSKFNNKDLVDIRVAASLLTNMAKVMTGVGTAMTVMKDVLLPLVNKPFMGTSDLAKIQSSTPELAEGIKSVIMFVRDGVLEPLRTTFNNKDLADLPVASRVMQTLGRLMQDVASSLKVVNDVIMPMADISFASMPADLGVGKIADFIKNGILSPIQSLGDTAQLSDAVTKVKALSAMLQELVVVLASLQAVMSQISSGMDIDANVAAVNKAMASLSKLNTAAIGAPVAVPPTTAAAPTTTAATAATTPVSPTAAATPTTAPDAPAYDSMAALKARRTAEAPAMERLAVEGVGGTDRTVQQMLPESFKQRQAEILERERIKNAAYSALPDPNIPTFANVANTPPNAWSATTQPLSVATPTNAPNIPTLDNEATAAANNLVNGTKGDLNIPAANRGEAIPPVVTAQPGSVTTAPYNAVQDRVAQSKNSNETVTNKTNTRDMSRIADANDQQTQYLAQIVAQNQELIDLLTPSSVSGSAGGQPGSTRTNSRIPMTPVDYGRWQFGKYQGNASKQVLNIGV